MGAAQDMMCACVGGGGGGGLSSAGLQMKQREEKAGKAPSQRQAGEGEGRLGEARAGGKLERGRGGWARHEPAESWTGEGEDRGL
ncbi:hypothetical protein ElyMa_003429700 [Elysia marginata]|uniref:Uncharacterized protein n=1 Tax=Elysia marginata TaxID=1093978 RepID=A0AAV4JWN2_9GAST|nr:hypothetical protein ElyMa_003429700 [Elysia marginata]